MPAQLLKWVFPLQGGSEDTGSCHREEAPLWSAFLGTQTAANPSLCHRPEHHHAPAGTAKEEAAVSTGHSPIPPAPKCSCPRSCKKRGRAPTPGAPSPPCQLLSQPPPPQTRARAQPARTGIRQDESQPPQNPSRGPKERVLVRKRILGTGSNNKRRARLALAAWGSARHIFPRQFQALKHKQTPAHTWHQAGTARPCANTRPWPPPWWGGLEGLRNGRLGVEDAAQRLHSGSPREGQGVHLNSGPTRRHHRLGC